MFPHGCKDHALFFQELYVPENLIHFKPVIVCTYSHYLSLSTARIVVEGQRDNGFCDHIEGGGGFVTCCLLI